MKEKSSGRLNWKEGDISIEAPSVQKGSSPDKVATVMREFSEGKLKTPQGTPVTDKNQALAIALSAAGLSNKSLQKAEILSKAKVLKAQLHEMIQKELSNDKEIKQELLAYFKGTNNPSDKDVHAIAEKHGIDPSEAEQLIYRILAEFFRGGKSKGRDFKIDQNEYNMGKEVEREHSEDPVIIEKIVRDHLAEDPKYYTKLKQVEGK